MNRQKISSFSEGPSKNGPRLMQTSKARSMKIDTTRRKTAQIAKLEIELQEKLSLATRLEKENDELQRKERILRAQVSRKINLDMMMVYLSS